MYACMCVCECVYVYMFVSPSNQSSIGKLLGVAWWRKGVMDKQISYITLNWGALDHVSPAPQLMSCNYYVQLLCKCGWS